MAKKQAQAAERCGRCGELPGVHRPQPGCPYNGWSNYETWAVGLWIDNEEPSYRHAHGLAREARTNSGDLAECWCGHERSDHQGDRCTLEGCSCTSPSFREARGLLADALKAWITEEAPELEASLFSDLLYAALSEVDWYELAEHFLDDE